MENKYVDLRKSLVRLGYVLIVPFSMLLWFPKSWLVTFTVFSIFIIMYEAALSEKERRLRRKEEDLKQAHRPIKVPTLIHNFPTKGDFQIAYVYLQHNGKLLPVEEGERVLTPVEQEDRFVLERMFGTPLWAPDPHERYLPRSDRTSVIILGQKYMLQK